MKRIVTFLLCLAYVLSPVDLLPEIALGPLGLPDDAIALVYGFKRLMGPGR